MSTITDDRETNSSDFACLAKSWPLKGLKRPGRDFRWSAGRRSPARHRNLVGFAEHPALADNILIAEGSGAR